MYKLISIFIFTILSISCFGCTISADPRVNFFDISDSFDMVVITPEIFSSNLEPLIDHKQTVGVQTYMTTVEEIYRIYDGRDEPEKIKFFIRDAINKMHISYVLLVGDIDLVPMRKTSGTVWLYSTPIALPTDHYYADIYTENGSFSSWDTNHNDKFGEFRWNDIGDYEWDDHTIDFIDLYPDVTVGRLLCRNENEVNTVVKKIIKYETKTYGKEWFNNFILMGGDTTKYGPIRYEGELVNELVFEGVQEYNFNPIKLWASLNKFNPIHINMALTKGAGFVCYSGHGVERGIATYETNGNDTLFYDVLYLFGVFNGNKLPVVFLDACLTANPEFNMDMRVLNIPCFAWMLTKKQFGGAIATIGSTMKGYVSRSNGIPQSGDSRLCIDFFNAYETGVPLGHMFKEAQETYLNEVGRDFYTIEINILYGDPSLKIGGYLL